MMKDIQRLLQHQGVASLNMFPVFYLKILLFVKMIIPFLFSFPLMSSL